MRLRALLVLCFAAPLALTAQQRGDTTTWSDSSTLELVNRAIARRTAQLADTGLTDYTARAHGYVTFLAQVGEGFPDPPRVMKTDELMVEVYWRAPDQSKQRIVGRRDTLLLPTDIQYHRDHLAIVQNNFPSVIRLGDGDEVRDVPHPLSIEGLEAYEFLIGDSLTIRTNERDIAVVMVRVRPRNDRLPRAVGAVYLDRATATVVRMAFSFTRAALRDTYLEDVSVVLENGLVDSRFWLPYRQEIEIRRTGTWLDFPTRGIIRGRWEICCVQANTGINATTMAGPEIVAADTPSELRKYPFEGNLLEKLPADVTVATDDDVRAVQDAARELVRAEALARVRNTNASARSVSDIIRVNRVEGLAFGAGMRQTLGGGFLATARVRYGTANRRAVGAAALAWRRANGLRFGIDAADDLLDAGDVAEVSGVRNSIAAQEFGTDFTDPYHVRRATLTLGFTPTDGLRWNAAVEQREESPVAVHATPTTGRYEPTLPAEPLRALRIGADIRRVSRGRGAFRATWQATFFGERVEITDGPRNGMSGWIGRGSLVFNAERRVTGGRWVTQTIAAGTVGGFAPPIQRLVYFGGPVTGPGFDFHQLSGQRGLSQRLEFQRSIPFIPIPLGRFGKVPSALTIAPFATGIWMDAPGTVDHGWRGSVGVGLLTLFDQLRFDVARGGRGGRWTFSVDVASALWPIL